MKLLLDYNPLTGERVWFGTTNENKVTITHEQDVDHYLKLAHAQYVDDEFTKQGMKNDWWKYASIPNIIIIEMKQKHGVDLHNKNHWPKILQLLNTEYSRFKTTSKIHRVRDR